VALDAAKAPFLTEQSGQPLLLRVVEREGLGLDPRVGAGQRQRVREARRFGILCDCRRRCHQDERRHHAEADRPERNRVRRVAGRCRGPDTIEAP
jgi:hypothetical protein